jgi:hypothetical protein
MTDPTAGDLLSEDGCPECDERVVTVSNDGKSKQDTFQCAAGHTWEEEWTCANCGDTEHDSIEFPQREGWDFDPEVEVDVTCESVYIVPVDGDGPGYAFNHDEFETIIEHFEESEYNE